MVYSFVFNALAIQYYNEVVDFNHDFKYITIRLKYAMIFVQYFTLVNCKEQIARAHIYNPLTRGADYF